MAWKGWQVFMLKTPLLADVPSGGQTSVSSLVWGTPVILQSQLVCIWHTPGAGILSTPFPSWETNTQSKFYLFFFNEGLWVPWGQYTRSTYLCISMTWSNLRSPSELLVDNLSAQNIFSSSFPILYLLLSESNVLKFQLRITLTSKMWCSLKSLKIMWMITISREDSIYT